MLRNIMLIMLAFSLLCVCCTPRKQKVMPVPQLSEIRNVGKLTLAEMAIGKTGTIDDLTMGDAKGMGEKARALLNKFKIGSRKGAYAYSTYMRAYIDLTDLSEADFRVDSGLRSVYVILPPIRTEFAGRDINMEELHYRVTGLRTNINAEERARLKEAMNSELKSEVENNPEFKRQLISKAREKASAFFTSFYGDLGYETFISFSGE